MREEQGRLDILVNNATSLSYPWPESVPFWKLPIAIWDEPHTVGLRSHYVASVFAAPIMIAQRSGRAQHGRPKCEGAGLARPPPNEKTYRL